MKRTTMPLSKTRRVAARIRTQAYYDCAEDSVGQLAASGNGDVNIQRCTVTRGHGGQIRLISSDRVLK